MKNFYEVFVSSKHIDGRTNRNVLSVWFKNLPSSRLLDGSFAKMRKMDKSLPVAEM